MGMVRLIAALVLSLLLGSVASVSGQVGTGPRVTSVDTIFTRVRFGDGTAAAPSRTYASDTDLGSYRIGADNEGFTAGGVLRWDYNTTRILSTLPFRSSSTADNYFLGKVGIGDQAPARDLNVTNATNAYVSITSGGVTRDAAVQFNDGTSTAYIGMMQSTGDVGALTFQLGTPRLVITQGGVISYGGIAGAATTTTRLLKKVTGIADNTATDVLTVTIPNANHAAAIKLRFVSSNGSTDAFESSRTAEGLVVLARTTGVATVATAAALDLTAIATVAAGATHTLAYNVSAIAGAAGAQQTFTVQVTIDDSGNLGSNQVVIVAEVLNAEATGVTIS